MNLYTTSAVIKLLALGLLLAVIKLGYIFFNFYNILDFVVFLVAGMMLGEKVPANRWVSGLLLSLPAFVLCLIFVINLGYSSIVNGVGTSFAVALIVIPAATCIGILIKAKRVLHKSEEKK